MGLTVIIAFLSALLGGLGYGAITRGLRSRAVKVRELEQDQTKTKIEGESDDELAKEIDHDLHPDHGNGD